MDFWQTFPNADNFFNEHLKFLKNSFRLEKVKLKWQTRSLVGGTNTVATFLLSGFELKQKGEATISKVTYKL